MPTPAHIQRPWHGVALFSTAVVLFACLDANAKYLAQTWPVGLLAWARYAGHLILMTVFLAPRWRSRLVTTERPLVLFLRGMLLVVVTVLTMTAFSRMPLAEASAIVFASPLMVVLASRPLLGERIGALRWTAVLVGLAGVLMLTRPGSGLDPLGVVSALGAAIAYSAYQLMTRKLSATEHPLTMLYYTALAGTAALSLALPVLGAPHRPSVFEIIAIAALGILGGGGHYLLTRAFREAPASLLSPMMYSQLVWATLLGWLVFGNTPTPATLTGILVIAAAGAMIAFDSTRQKPPA